MRSVFGVQVAMGSDQRTANNRRWRAGMGRIVGVVAGVAGVEVMMMMMVTTMGERRC